MVVFWSEDCRAADQKTAIPPKKEFCNHLYRFTIKRADLLLPSSKDDSAKSGGKPNIRPLLGRIF